MSDQEKQFAEASQHIAAQQQAAVSGLNQDVTNLSSQLDKISNSFAALQSLASSIPPPQQPHPVPDQQQPSTSGTQQSDTQQLANNNPFNQQRPSTSGTQPNYQRRPTARGRRVQTKNIGPIAAKSKTPYPPYTGGDNATSFLQPSNLENLGYSNANTAVPMMQRQVGDISVPATINIASGLAGLTPQQQQQQQQHQQQQHQQQQHQQLEQQRTTPGLAGLTPQQQQQQQQHQQQQHQQQQHQQLEQQRTTPGRHPTKPIPRQPGQQQSHSTTANVPLFNVPNVPGNPAGITDPNKLLRGIMSNQVLSSMYAYLTGIVNDSRKKEEPKDITVYVSCYNPRMCPRKGKSHSIQEIKWKMSFARIAGIPSVPN